MSNEEWSRGPTMFLPEGLLRFLVIYRVRLGSGWKLFKMEKTGKENTEHTIAAELHARLQSKGKRFEIVDVQSLGNEVAVDGGTLISQKEWDEIQAKHRAALREEDIKELAQEKGIYIPKPGKLVH